MKITDGDDLYIEISSARVLLSILTGSLGEISGHYDEHGWFIPNDDTQNLNHFFYSFEKWMELVRVIFDKLDEAYSYLHNNLIPEKEKAPVSPTRKPQTPTNNSRNRPLWLLYHGGRPESRREIKIWILDVELSAAFRLSAIAE